MTATAVIATPAAARDGAWYVGGDFGAMIVEDTDVDVNGVEDALSLNHEYGFDGALFVGYDLGAFRSRPGSVTVIGTLNVTVHNPPDLETTK